MLPDFSDAMWIGVVGRAPPLCAGSVLQDGVPRGQSRSRRHSACDGLNGRLVAECMRGHAGVRLVRCGDGAAMKTSSGFACRVTRLLPRRTSRRRLTVGRRHCRESCPPRVATDGAELRSKARWLGVGNRRSAGGWKMQKFTDEGV